jgi:dTDP-4-dehydrorhamnose 3,5-epimerase
MIEGVVFKDLVTRADDRGFFREVIRSSDDFFSAGFGQLSHSLIYPGVVKAWHAHRYQTQWNYVLSGLLKVVLHDWRPDSSTAGRTMEFLTGDLQPVRVYSLPPGVLHGYRCVAGPAQVIYVTSGVYDLFDEVRLAYNDPEIGYDWLKAQEIR